MRNLFRRIGAIMLVLCLLATMLPATVLAEGLDSADGLTDVSDKVVYNSKSTYVYDGNPVTFDPSCEGISKWSITYYDSVGGPLGYDAPSVPGSYTVQMKGEDTYCYANVRHSFSIVKGQIDYSVGNYSARTMVSRTRSA